MFEVFGERINTSTYDYSYETAFLLKKKLTNNFWHSRLQVLDNFASQCQKYPYILEATPSKDTILDELISDQLRIAAPGVPLGISRQSFDLVKDRLVHDKLELGVAVTTP